MEFKTKKALVRKIQERDIAEIAKNIRKSDRIELWSISHLNPEQAIRESFDNSDFCWTVEREKKPVAMFGVGKPNIVWMLCTNDFKKLNGEFLRRSREYINIMLESYPVLENYVSVDNIHSIKWLSFCGAKFSPPEPYGLDNNLFHKFKFERKNESA